MKVTLDADGGITVTDVPMNSEATIETPDAEVKIKLVAVQPEPA